MTLTLPELKQKLIEKCDPDRLVELLNLSSENIAEAFLDEIEERFDSLSKEFGDEDEDSN